MSAPDLSLIIPCYRDARHLRANAAAVIRTLRDIRLTWEIIFVNDASPENDAEVASQVIADWPGENIRLISHPKNTGRGQAVTTGMAEAQGRYAGFLDIDLEVAAHYIMPALQLLTDGADVVCAERIYKNRPGLIHRAIFSHGYAMLVSRLFGMNLPDTEAGYKFFRMETVRPVLAVCKDPGWFWDTEIMARSREAGLDIRFLPVLFLRNPDKASTVRLVNDSVVQFRRLLQFRKQLRRPQ